MRAYKCMQTRVESHKLVVASIGSFCQLDVMRFFFLWTDQLQPDHLNQWFKSNNSDMLQYRSWFLWPCWLLSSLIADLGSSFWGMVFILASTNLITTRIAAGCFLLALVVVLFVAKNVSNLYYLTKNFQNFLDLYHLVVLLYDLDQNVHYNFWSQQFSCMLIFLFCVCGSCSGCFEDSV